MTPLQADYFLLVFPEPLLPPELRLPPDEDLLPPELERAGDELLELEPERALLLRGFEDFFDLSLVDFLSPLDLRVPSAFLSRLDFVGLLCLRSTCFVSLVELLLSLLRVVRFLSVDRLSVLFSGSLGL